jgi:hypothetical protein
MIYQVFYDKQQAVKIEDEFMGFYNPKCSVYFENQVIMELSKHGAVKSDPYFGVLSWNLREKIERMKGMRQPFRNVSKEENPVHAAWSKMEKGDELITFMEHVPHCPINAANEIHPEFRWIWIQLMTHLKLHPHIKTWEKVIYCNAFILKSNLYDRYINELLLPAMHIMDGEISYMVMEDSKYPKFFTPELSEQTGMGHWTYHTFICERLFSYWYNFMK